MKLEYFDKSKAYLIKNEYLKSDTLAINMIQIVGT